MDQNRISNKKSHVLDRHLFVKMTLQLVLPVSVASFLISYTCTRFSILSSYHFVRTLVCPLFTHVFERKYMFLICNGILAFLMKTLNLNNNNSSSYSLSDLDGHIDLDGYSSPTIPPVVSSSEDFEDAVEDDDHEEEQEAEGDDVNVDEDDHEEEQEAEAEAESVEGDGVNVVEDDFVEISGTGDFVIESEGFDLDDEEENVEDEYIGGGGGLMGDDQVDVMINMDTEDLNRKFEEFIRKMKEELRIQEQQYQLVVAV